MGALNEEEAPTSNATTTEDQPAIPVSSSFNNNTLYSDKPILFKGQRSATFDESTQLNKNMHRSETMPGSSVASSLANLGSSFKLNFG